MHVGERLIDEENKRVLESKEAIVVLELVDNGWYKL